MKYIVQTVFIHVSYQVLVLTHELSNPAEYSDYLAQVLQPAKVLMVLGRSRDAFPKCSSEECVYYAWRDRNAL